MLGAGEDGKTIQPEGIRAGSLNAAQQQMLLDLAREWVGILNDEAAAADLAAAGEHRLSFRNDHLPELGAYLVNALVPTTSEIKLGGQERDPLQREMRLIFRVTPADARGPRTRAGVLLLCLCLVLLFPRRKQLLRYLRRPER